jgi:hypothetical protein
MNRHVGFTGTREGLTLAQSYSVEQLLREDILTLTAHHGDCIGADADFHVITKSLGFVVHGHPPINPSKRALCSFDSMEEEEKYIERNHDIVDVVDWMIACPSGYKEELRSGTWATIRYARSLYKPGCIVWPDGKVTDIMDDWKTG